MIVYSKPALDLAVERAVAAERERCAKIAENFRDYTGVNLEDKNDLIGMFGRGNRNARVSIAAAIRTLKQP